MLGADLLYERRNVAPLLELLPPLLGERGELWLADPGRAPAEDFLAACERLARGADGRVTVYRLRPRMRTLVFLHGLLTDQTLWRKVVPALGDGHRGDHADAAARLAHDVRCPAADLTPPGLARQVADMLGPADEVLLVGNDTGGAIAQLVAANHPERVGGLVLTNCDAYERFFPPLFKPLQYAARVPGGVEAIAASLRVPAVRRLPIAYGKLAKRPIERAVTDAWAAPSRDPAHPAPTSGASCGASTAAICSTRSRACASSTSR